MSRILPGGLAVSCVERRKANFPRRAGFAAVAAESVRMWVESSLLTRCCLSFSLEVQCVHGSQLHPMGCLSLMLAKSIPYNCAILLTVSDSHPPCTSRDCRMVGPSAAHLSCLSHWGEQTEKLPKPGLKVGGEVVDGKQRAYVNTCQRINALPSFGFCAAQGCDGDGVYQ